MIVDHFNRDLQKERVLGVTKPRSTRPQPREVKTETPNPEEA